ncbi:ornithine cyclodeaminase family protein [Jannaschia formosa]|uniref:ornithine cyclodeaminase family protein n=1 Tax=Jannaschia formosa TaxID=2259592 RepID=UPI000E1C2F1B|nr:ornithine cyclodeaminase family protein [Jannaschia formosa]TFL15926.1 ornithine cyclodeaminase family protein [Jannaschia formosa]
MILVTEAESSAIVTPELAFAAVREAFIAAVAPGAASFPVVLAHGSNPQNRFTIKSASGAELAGLKVGAYFPTNDARGLPRHASTILLIDQTTGRIGALVEGSAVNCYRTAAADAVATDVLARPDAEVLTLLGTGHQAAFEAQAIARIRKLSRLLVVGRDPFRTEAFVEKLRSSGLPAEAAAAEAAVRAADIIVTATTATAPLFEAAWLQPATHISSMGSDSQGKQELPAGIFRHASLFCDLPEQSVRIGEFQHAGPEATPTAIGVVLSGDAPGRRDESEITIFDSSCISMQDLHMAKAILDRHAVSGVAFS